MQSTQELIAADLAAEINDEALAELFGDEASVTRLIEEEADTSLLPSALSVIAVTAVLAC